MNISELKIQKLKILAKELSLEFVEISNGISVKNKDITFTFYSGPKGTYCIDRKTGNIEKGHGFDKFVKAVEENLNPENIKIDISEAFEMLKKDEYVFFIDLGNEVEVTMNHSIYAILDEILYKKRKTYEINGSKFFSKEDAIKFINSI